MVKSRTDPAWPSPFFVSHINCLRSCDSAIVSYLSRWISVEKGSFFGVCEYINYKSNTHCRKLVNFLHNSCIIPPHRDNYMNVLVCFLFYKHLYFVAFYYYFYLAYIYSRLQYVDIPIITYYWTFTLFTVFICFFSK